MDTHKTNKHPSVVGPDFFERSWEQSWTYIKTVVDVVHEPVLILDEDYRVLAANGPFYEMFQVEAKDTENRLVYKLGNGQWDIPKLRKLIEDILPKNSFFKGFEVTHKFPSIGHKTMILNARQIHIQKGPITKALPAIILLAIEDITEMMDVAKRLAEHTSKFEVELTGRTQKMETRIVELKNEIATLKARS